jgi:hypothetical protein
MHDQDIPFGYCHCGCGEKTNLARQSLTSAGWVRGEPLKWIVGHIGRTKRGVPLDPTRARYIEEDRGFTSPCWIWQLSLLAAGYGQVSGGKTAHVVYYTRKHGPIPPGLHLDHLCRVRECVNPDHLEPVTCAENIRRARTRN